ncbi:MAG TPA: hypothetical protein VF202_01165 [Trueperaceae bacterium]
MTYVLGVDPGPVVGLVGLHITPDLDISPRPDIIQCSADTLNAVLGGLILDVGVRGLNSPELLVAVERFVIGPRTGRLNAGGASRTAVHIVGMLADRSRAGRAYRYVARSAAEVKPWATDARLGAVGLLEPTKGMRHARDAARHALFAAVRDCGVPDPLARTHQLVRGVAALYNAARRGVTG